jgi:transcriptional regulator with XRE-family HTH domain
MAARKKKNGKTNSDLTNVVRDARKKKGWSQAVLSQEASVATRTIVAIEKGEGRPEKQIVIRLAQALDADLPTWLRRFGHEDATDEEIHAAMRGARRLHFAGERPPETYFKELRARLAGGRKLLMCVAYTSPPGASQRPAVRDLLLSCINEGLFVAMVSPFPRILNPVTVPKPALSFYQIDTYSRTLAFAREVYEKLPPNKRDRVALFAPNLQSPEPATVHCIPPPMGLAEYRPTLVADFSEGRSNDSSFELAAWFVMQQDRRDRWLPIFPSAKNDDESIASSYRHLQYWKDYFAEIFAAFSRGTWRIRKDDQTSSAWRLEFPTEAISKK